MAGLSYGGPSPKNLADISYTNRVIAEKMRLAAFDGPFPKTVATATGVGR